MDHWLLEDHADVAERDEGESALPRSIARNRLLRHLTTLCRELPNDLERRTFADGELWPADRTAAHEVVFPLASVATLVQESMDGHLAPLALVGNEGLWDYAAFAHEPKVGRRAWIVHCGGEVLVVHRDKLVAASHAFPGVHRALCNWDRVLLDRVAQSALCNRHHDVAQQIATFLLLHQRRYRMTSLAVTQTTLARLLGLRRESVSRSIGKLAAMGAVNNDESRICIASTSRLKTCACECWQADAD